MAKGYIELNAFVKVLGLASTGGQAKILIRSGTISVNGEIDTRNKRKLIAGDLVSVNGKKYAVDSSLF